MEALLPIATQRLVLRAMEQGDVDVLAAYRNDPEVARYQDWELPYPMESARRVVAAGADRTGPVPGEWIQIAVTRQGRLIGDVAVGLDGAGTQARIGYTLAREHQGMGYAAEAVGAVIDGLFDRLHLHRIEATLDPDNVASARLVERLGFRYQGTAASAVLVRGRWEDDARYGLTPCGSCRLAGSSHGTTRRRTAGGDHSGYGGRRRRPGDPCHPAQVCRLGVGVLRARPVS